MIEFLDEHRADLSGIPFNTVCRLKDCIITYDDLQQIHLPQILDKHLRKHLFFVNVFHHLGIYLLSVLEQDPAVHMFNTLFEQEMQQKCGTDIEPIIDPMRGLSTQYSKMLYKTYKQSLNDMVNKKRALDLLLNNIVHVRVFRHYIKKDITKTSLMSIKKKIRSLFFEKTSSQYEWDKNLPAQFEFNRDQWLQIITRIKIILECNSDEKLYDEDAFWEEVCKHHQSRRLIRQQNQRSQYDHEWVTRLNRVLGDAQTRQFSLSIVDPVFTNNIGHEFINSIPSNPVLVVSTPIVQSQGRGQGQKRGQSQGRGQGQGSSDRLYRLLDRSTVHDLRQ